MAHCAHAGFLVLEYARRTRQLQGLQARNLQQRTVGREISLENAQSTRLAECMFGSTHDRAIWRRHGFERDPERLAVEGERVPVQGAVLQQ